MDAPSDPTSVFFEALRAYLSAVHPRFPVERIKLIASDGSKIDLHVVLPVVVHFDHFLPTPFQQAILDALEGKAMRTDALGAAVGDRSRLFRPGGLKELRERGLVDHHERRGFYRPDSPPEELA